MCINAFRFVGNTGVFLQTISKFEMQLHRVPDVDSLMLHFTNCDILNLRQHEEIKKMSSGKEKMEKLLENIVLTLQENMLDPFRDMLNAMENHGSDISKSLAITMKNEITILSTG